MAAEQGKTSGIAGIASTPAASAAEMSKPVVLLFAVAAGLAVASIYYAHPLLDAMRQSLHMSVATTGLVVTASQLGYAFGLTLLVPLGDLLERRRLVVWMTVGISVCLAGMAMASSAPAMLAAAMMVGALSVVAQILVAFAATLAGPAERGRVVGTVMSGLLLGILLARTAAGYLAQLGSWRTTFWVAAGLMLALAVVLQRALPTYYANVGMNYPALMRSVLTLLKEEPVLRLRALYGAVAFGAFSVLWTPLAFLLSQPPYQYSPGTIGMFGLVGVAGALAASAAGRIADMGGAHRVTGGTAALLAVSWIPMKLGDHSVAMLVVGIVLLDLAAQGLHITNQSEIYRLRPDARSRITSAYMAIFFAGGVLGSALSSFTYAHAGWTGVCLLGGGFGAVATAVWLSALRRR